MCDSIGGCMKKLVARVVLALFVANIACTSMAVEASWLSKAWQRLEKSLEKSEEISKLPKPNDPQSNYIREQSNPAGIGPYIPKYEMTVSGIPMGIHVNDVKKSLGKPTSEDVKTYGRNYPIYTLTYGGVTFETSKPEYSPYTKPGHISKTTINNRDGVTLRGISVGDRLMQVYYIYGRPTFVSRDEWFYGKFGNDVHTGIWFVHDGYKVTKIKLGTQSFEHIDSISNAL